MPGQLPLLPRQPWSFTREHAHRLADRDFPEREEIIQTTERIRVRENMGLPWRSSGLELMPLALAAREAGERLVDEYVVAELPRARRAVAAVLREAGLLRRRSGSWLAQAGYQLDRWRKVSWEHCLSWAGDAKPLCDCCREWARRLAKRPGPCDRCGRVWPLKDGKCRFCHQVLHDHIGGGHIVEQLWFGGSTPGLRTRRPGGRVHGPRHHAALRPVEGTAEDCGLSPVLLSSSQTVPFPPSPRDWPRLKHINGPCQLELFPAPPRDWTRVQDKELPELCPLAAELVEEFRQYATARRWTVIIRANHLRSGREVRTAG